jgi:hypothetical protein
VFWTLFMPVAIVFGIVLHGAAAVLIFLTYSILSAYATWGIFRQKLIGWQIALYNACFWTASMLVTCLRRPDMLQLFREMGYNDPSLHIYDRFPQFLTLFWVGMIGMMTLLLLLILYTRKFFPAEEQA